MKSAVVIGSGPNGLAAAITMARAGWEVTVHEAADTVGGGMRSEELTLPGFTHDVCSAIHPLGRESPFFRDLELPVGWVQPDAPAAHPLDDGTAVTTERSLPATAEGLEEDRGAYLRVVNRVVSRWSDYEPVVLGPFLPRPNRLLHAVDFSFARAGLSSAPGLANASGHERARALLAGHAAHSMLPLETRPSGGVGLFLIATAHVFGWGFPRSGSQSLANALVDRLQELGGEIHTASPVDELPRADVVLADVVPRELLRIAGDRFPAHYARRYRHGPGVFKLDWALDGPIPWTADDCRRAATVHLGGTFEEIAESERAPREGRHAERPYVLLTQPSLFDDSRAPAGQHTAWAYCHVPFGSTEDMTDRIEAQVERFAPGFRELIRARSAMGPADLERHNRNLVGGDINGGTMDLAPALLPAGAEARVLPHSAQGRVPLLVLHSARWGRPRNVRVLRGADRAGRQLGSPRMSTTVAYDVDAVRARFSALQRPLAFFDGPGGTQCPDEVIDAISSYLRESNANIGAPYETSRRTDALIEHARRRAAALPRLQRRGGRVRAEHDRPQLPAHAGVRANLDPATRCSSRSSTTTQTWPRGWSCEHDLGIVVRFVEVTDDMGLDYDDLERQLSDRTRVVAFPVAANSVGTALDVRRIVELAHSAGALAWADAVHYGPHGPIDVAAWDVDVLFCSPYKFYGPHLGLAFGKRDLLASWRPYKVRPAANEPVGARFELGTLQHELLAGFVAAVDYIDSLGWDAITRHERELGERFLAGLPASVRLHGQPTMSGRVPTFCFDVPGLSPEETAERLAERDLAVWWGNYYALETMKRLGLDTEQGAVRAGIVHYNTAERSIDS